MSFDYYNSNKPTDDAIIDSCYVPIAVLCAFTSTGEIIVKKYKYQDDSGMYREVQIDRIITSEKKRYAALLSVYFNVEVTIDDTKYEQIIIYNTVESTWKLKVKK